MRAPIVSIAKVGACIAGDSFQIEKKRSKKMKLAKPILLGGAAAGVLDLIYAFIVYGMLGITVLAICQSIAAGLLGRASYEGGGSTAALGVVLHFFITTLMAAGFGLAARSFPVLLKKPVISGLVYGLLMFFLMNFVVVPLSAVGWRPLPTGWLLFGTVFTHTVLVGLPIALIARRYLPVTS
jgi:hypothetical protein